MLDRQSLTAAQAGENTGLGEFWVDKDDSAL